MGETIGKLTREQQAVLGIQNAPWSLWKSPHLCLNVLFGQQWIVTTSWNKIRKLLVFVMWCCFCCLWLNITSWLHVYVFWREKVGWTLDEAAKKTAGKTLRNFPAGSQIEPAIKSNSYLCWWKSTLLWMNVQVRPAWRGNSDGESSFLNKSMVIIMVPCWNGMKWGRNTTFSSIFGHTQIH